MDLKIEALKESMEKTGETVTKKTNDFHNEFIDPFTKKNEIIGKIDEYKSKVAPELPFYDSIRKGDWNKFRKEAAITTALVAVYVTVRCNPEKVAMLTSKAKMILNKSRLVNTGKAFLARDMLSIDNALKITSSDIVKNESKQVIAKEGSKIIKKTIADSPKIKIMHLDKVITDNHLKLKSVKITPKEIDIIKKQNGVRRKINGHNTIITKNIDKHKKSIMRFNGMPQIVNNQFRTSKGLAPIGSDGLPVNMHHRGQKNTSTLVEMLASDHKKFHSILHDQTKKVSEIDRNTFNNITRPQHWKARSEMFDSEPLYKELINITKSNFKALMDGTYFNYSKMLFDYQRGKYLEYFIK